MNEDQQRSNLRQGYYVLAERANQALRTGHSLDECLREGLMLQQSIHINSSLFALAELSVIEATIQQILLSITDEKQRQASRPERAIQGLQAVHEGRRGKPSYNIDDAFLRSAFGTAPDSRIAKALGCSARTVRRRAIEMGLVPQGNPVFLRNEDGDRVHQGNSRAKIPLSREDLDRLVRDAIQRFPRLGHRLLHGHLRQEHPQYLLSNKLIRASIRRIEAVPRSFTRPRIHRREYVCKGPMAVVHHDGHHKLIRYKIVIHGFIDGYSRYVLSLRANDNNRASTVYHQFREDIVSVHGTPEKIRGDHGTENIDVAIFEDTVRGPGSYIWGRSTHNTRIERLWNDVRNGFGAKWKDFFHDLEEFHNLDIDAVGHIWLLHYLFLAKINADCKDWTDAYNYHALEVENDGSLCPHARFTLGMMEKGCYASAPIPTEDLQIDLDMDGITLPQRMNTIEVDESTCPFSNEQLQALQERLDSITELESSSMGYNTLIWLTAVEYYNEIM